jgi:hypothetical protein
MARPAEVREGVQRKKSLCIICNCSLGPGHQWLTPVILATQEAEIRRIVVWSQPRQIVPQDHILKKTLHCKGLVEWLKV